VNPALSIALPTYNRAAFLDSALAKLLPIVAPYAIRILVSDNKSTDDTAAVVARHKAAYPLLDYACNAENLGPDGNFEVALRDGSTRYVWLLGDTYEIEPAALTGVMAAIEGAPALDAIIVDVEGRATEIPAHHYTDRNALLTDLGWHMTCMSALILSRDLITAGAFERYRNTSFIHVGIIFDHIARHAPQVLWLNGPGVRSLRVEGAVKVSVWEKRTFDIWVDSWTGFVLSLPAIYTIQAKLTCILRHGERSGLFSLANLVKLRGGGVLDTATVRHRWVAMRLATGRRRFLILACAFVPRAIARAAMRAKGAGR
jgi:abequosyltransferase